MSQRTFLPKSYVSRSLTPLNYLRPMVLALLSIPFVHYGPVSVCFMDYRAQASSFLKYLALPFVWVVCSLQLCLPPMSVHDK